MRWWLDAAAPIASSRTEFAGKKTHQRKLRPLRGAKRVKQLLLGVLEGGTDGIDGGNRQARTSLSPGELAARYR
jgi:hypothetical protein